MRLPFGEEVGLGLLVHPVPCPGSEQPFDWGWAIGLFEGEGSMSKATKSYAIVCALGSTDEDTLRHFHAIVGVGKVRGPIAPTHSRKKALWVWDVSGDNAAWLVERMLPYLSLRRSQRARELLAMRRDARAQMLKSRVCPICNCEFSPARLRPGVHFVIYCSTACGRESLRRRAKTDYQSRKTVEKAR